MKGLPKQDQQDKMDGLNIAMLSVHSSPLGELGKRNNGGMSVYIIELAAELKKFGHRIDIFTLRRSHYPDQAISMGGRTRLIHIDIGDINGQDFISGSGIQAFGKNGFGDHIGIFKHCFMGFG